MVLEFDNLQGYRDAYTYDQLNSLNEIESKFYFDLADKQGGPILDVACGTGRLTIPLAERGFNISGLDIIPEMLAAAKLKAANLGISVKWIQADARQFELGQVYPFIFTTGNAFQHFLDRESVDGMLASVYRHLDEDGVFAFETRNPVISNLIANENVETDVGSWTDKNGNHHNSTYRRTYDPKSQLEHYVFTNRQWTDALDVVETIEPFTLRYFFPQELESLLYYNGLKLEAVYGNFDLSPFEADSPLMVCVCRKQLK